MITKPMLAGTVNAEQLCELEYPVMVSYKIDGIRCLIHPDLGPVTRSFKPIPNGYIRDVFSRYFISSSYLDGELVATDRDSKDLPFNDTQSRVMSRAGDPYFKYYVFDDFEVADKCFQDRQARAKERVDGLPEFAHFLEQVIIFDAQGVKDYFDMAMDKGHEGVMIRSVGGPYKSGRSTRKQGWLLKYKEMADAEGTITGFEELLHNDNPDLRDEFDRAKRSSHKENLVPAGTLGALILSTEWGTLKVGTGFDASQREFIWKNRTSLKGQEVTFKYQPHGMQDLPRFPVFKGFRHD